MLCLQIDQQSNYDFIQSQGVMNNLTYMDCVSSLLAKGYSQEEINELSSIKLIELADMPF